MKNIVSGPQDNMNDITVKFNLGKRRFHFEILTNIATDEMAAVIDNWASRTDTYSAESLINYINSNHQYGFKAELKHAI